MANKILTIEDQSNDVCDVQTCLIDYGVRSSKLWLFLIGGSAAGIIPPLLRYFLSLVHHDIIVPVFIDRIFHSHTTSSSISYISKYEEFCRLTCAKSKIAKPFFFVEDSFSSLLVVKNFNAIQSMITKGDQVFIAFSIHSVFNVSVALDIGKMCGNKVASEFVSYGLFLPYIAFSTNEKPFDIINDISTSELQKSVTQNLDRISNEISDKSKKFVLGLPEKIIVDESSYQRNPFNILSLIMAFAVVAVANNDGEWISYVIESNNDGLSPSDIVPIQSFRQSLISLDFLRLSYDFLTMRQVLPDILKGDTEKTKFITEYLHSASDDILSLADMTVHRKNRMKLRKSEQLKKDLLNEVFKYKTYFGQKCYSKDLLTKELMKSVDVNSLYTANMAAHEVLLSIQSFIKCNYETISRLYF